MKNQETHADTRRQLLAVPSTDLLGTSWIPKTNGQNLPWKVTDIFVSINGRTAVQIEKYQGGRNSPSIITTKRLRRFFVPNTKVTHRVPKIKPMKTHTTTYRDSVEFTALFDLGSVRMDSPRLKEIKENDIQTHHAPHMEAAPWLAIPMKAARSLLDEYDLTEDESGSVPGIMAGYCRLLDEAGYTFEGDSEREVQDAALDFCRSNREIAEPVIAKSKGGAE